MKRPSAVPVGSQAYLIPRIFWPISSRNFDWNEAALAMKTGLRLWLRQLWLPRPEPDFSPGWVRLGLQGSHLLLYARLRDDQPQNRATLRNQKMWETGDVVELFLQKDGCDDYYELHVTPENQRLQLHFPDSSALKSGLPLQSWMVEKDIFESFTHVHPSRTRWQAFLRVDLAFLFGALPSRLRFLIGRYDAQPGRSDPVISSSALLTDCVFHKIPEWSQGEIAPV